MTKKVPHLSLILLVLLPGTLWVSCTQERQPCLTPKIASFIIHTTHFPTDTSLTVADTAMPAAMLLALTNTGAKGGYYPLQSSFTLSLSSVSDTCRWLFAPDTTGTPAFDTLTFYYQRKLQFLSNACGYAYFYNLDTAFTTHTYIDSVTILNRSVNNNVNTTHLQIYIHPDY